MLDRLTDARTLKQMLLSIETRFLAFRHCCTAIWHTRIPDKSDFLALLKPLYIFFDIRSPEPSGVKISSSNAPCSEDTICALLTPWVTASTQ